MDTRMYEISRLGHKIQAQVTHLDQGLHVLIAGGTRSHVGAISYVNPSTGEAHHFQALNHRDLVISQAWAEALSEKLGGAVTVSCGIHYDHVGKEDIAEIVKGTEELLAHIMSSGETEV